MDRKINISQRGFSIFYIDRAKIYTRQSTLAYSLSDTGKIKSFNIPYLNTSILMLGPSTSITNEAVRLFSQNSGIIMFTGNNGIPVYGNTIDDFTILQSNSEYGPTQYAQQMFNIFTNHRLEAAKELSLRRIQITQEIYDMLDEAKEIGLNKNEHKYIFTNFEQNILKSKTINELLLAEARYTKNIYAIAANCMSINFKRDNKKYKDPINEHLTHSNYLMYGYSAVTLTGLGIPYSLPLMHGKTRRGALVFDVADLLKDGISIPMAFYHGINTNLSDYDFRYKITDFIEKKGILKRLFEEIIYVLKKYN